MKEEFTEPLMRIDCKKHVIEFGSLPVEFKPLDMNDSYLIVDGHHITAIQYIKIEKGLNWTTIIARISPRFLNETEWGRELLAEGRIENQQVHKD